MPLPRILIISALTVAIPGLIAQVSHAMQMQVAGNQLILRGNDRRGNKRERCARGTRGRRICRRA